MQAAEPEPDMAQLQMRLVCSQRKRPGERSFGGFPIAQASLSATEIIRRLPFAGSLDRGGFQRRRGFLNVATAQACTSKKQVLGGGARIVSSQQCLDFVVLAKFETLLSQSCALD